MSTLSIQLPNSILEHARRLARDKGVSIHQLASSALAEKLSALDADRHLNERTKRGQQVDIEGILAKIPATEPEPHDRLPPSDRARPARRSQRTTQFLPSSARFR